MSPTIIEDERRRVRRESVIAMIRLGTAFLILMVYPLNPLSINYSYLHLGLHDLYFYTIGIVVHFPLHGGYFFSYFMSIQKAHSKHENFFSQAELLNSSFLYYNIFQ